MESRTVPASMEYLDEVMAPLDAFLCEEGCPEDDRRLVEVSVEELFTNIASYAYGPDGGSLRLDYEIREGQAGGKAEKTVWLRFSDRGVPYDPFAREDPDIRLPIEERPVGGLGVYMVKRFMDDVSYTWKDGCNVTVIAKRFPAEKPRDLQGRG